MSLTVQIHDKAVTALFRRIERAGPTARKVVAHSAARCTQDHFRAKNSRYYGRAINATTGRVQGDDVVVSIDHTGIALRRYGSGGLPGGVVKPKRGKYLAIPDSDNPQAKNNAPRRIGGLHFRRNAAGNKYGESGRLTDSTGRVFFWLTQAAKHEPDPSVLPTDSDFERAIMPDLEHHLENI